MAHLVRSDIPFHYALADAFTICDAYHCSLFGPTDPNRYYMWTGWVGNDGSGGGPVVDNAEAAKWRRSVSGDLTSAFNCTSPNDAKVQLPSTVAYIPPDNQRHPDYVPIPPTIQTLPVQESVLRKCLPTLVGDRFASVRIQDQAARRKLEMMFSPMIVIKIKHVEQSPCVLVK